MEAIRWFFLLAGPSFSGAFLLLQPPGDGLAHDARLVARGLAALWTPFCWILARECRE